MCGGTRHPNQVPRRSVSDSLGKSGRNAPGYGHEHLCLVASAIARARALSGEIKVRRPWSPTKYRAEGRRLGIPDKAIQIGLDAAAPPQEKGLPAILNLRHLAKMSGTDHSSARG